MWHANRRKSFYMKSNSHFHLYLLFANFTHLPLLKENLEKHLYLFSRGKDSVSLHIFFLLALFQTLRTIDETVVGDIIRYIYIGIISGESGFYCML